MISGRRLARRTQVLLTIVNLMSNVVGAAVVVSLLAFIVPTPPGEGGFGRINEIVVPIYVLAATVIGAVGGTRLLLPRLRWIREEAVPTPAEQKLALRAPLQLLGVSGLLWVGATVLFTVVNGLRSTQFVAPIIFTVASGGITTCATTYLLNERVLRPVAALALSHDPPDRQLVPGVTSRSLLAWVLGSAVPVGGLISIAIYTLAGRKITVDRLAIAILGLGGITISVGFLTTLLAARATTAAVQSVRVASSRWRRATSPCARQVFDGTQVGLLQAGFNRMAEGLQEREPHPRPLRPPCRRGRGRRRDRRRQRSRRRGPRRRRHLRGRHRLHPARRDPPPRRGGGRSGPRPRRTGSGG